jgi:asparagine synthase (glutamine-hydrolysing)
MSGIAVVYERSNIPVDHGILERVMKRLEHLGPDGRDDYQCDHIAMGHWHFWTTPEELGEKQPLELPGLPFRLVLDGRLDNRPELIAELGLQPSDGNRLSDAALILLAYEHWGEHCLEHFIGPFALVIFNERDGELLCVRDALGDRTLFYSWKGTRLVIASEAWAASGAEAEIPELDDVCAARYFAIKDVEDGRTFFKGVSELLPAQVLVINQFGERRWLYWQVDSSARLHYRTDKEYAEHFLSLFEQGVRSRLRSITPVGVLMSGGLDSTSVACVAARMIAPLPLTTFSFVFDELLDCDEREYINAVQALWGIRSIQIPCDDLWTFKDWIHWPSNPNQPEGNVYRLLKERTYQRVEKTGLRVLMTGSFGDQLYNGSGEWLVDRIAEGQLWKAVQELYFYIHHAGVRWTFRAGYLQEVARRFFQPLLRGRLSVSGSSTPAWLTDEAARLLSVPGLQPRHLSRRQAGIIGMREAIGSSREIFNASRNGIELRHPYRDRRLVEFVMSIPAHQVLRYGYLKFILRNAMHGLLPDIIRSRPSGTSLDSLFFRGVEQEKDILNNCFLNPQAAWRKFVDEKWILNRWNGIWLEDGPEGSVPWSCITYESWHQKVIS